jgi:hypothetical protein
VFNHVQLPSHAPPATASVNQGVAISDWRRRSWFVFTDTKRVGDGRRKEKEVSGAGREWNIQLDSRIRCLAWWREREKGGGWEEEEEEEESFKGIIII